MNLSVICDVIILAAATIMAVTNIISLIRKGGKGISAAHKRQIIEVIDEIMPDMLLAHDLETRKKYQADRQKYLE
jgi:hypothetical protein